MTLSIIVAVSENGVIGRDGKIPWRIPDDFRFFKEVTMGHTLIMGRKTYESIGRPLPGRTTIVVSSNPDLPLPAGVRLVRSFVAAFGEAIGTNRSDETFICGGAQAYSGALQFAERLYLTRVHAEIEGDAVVPELAGGVPDDFMEVTEPLPLSTEGATHRATLHIYNRRAS